MRRCDREVKDQQGIADILTRCKVCRIAMQDDRGLYIVPVNFGYVFEDGKLTLYFHGAREGRKAEALRERTPVAFEMDCDHRLTEGSLACEYSFSYSSITGSGTASFVDDFWDKQKALALLMKHQTGKDFLFTRDEAEAVAVFAVMADTFSAKRRA